jgi:RNA polymerase sigma-B factor
MDAQSAQSPWISERQAGDRTGRSERPRRLPTDSAERQRENVLLRRYARSRSTAVREELVHRFMPLARSLAMRYRGGTEALDDLVQVASYGLVKAIDGYDPARGRPFSAYAVPTILGELRRHFRDNVWNLHLPRGLQELTMRVDEAIAELTERLGKSPTVAQIAERLEIEQDEVLEGLRAGTARRTLSLDVPHLRDDGDSVPTVETIADDELGYDLVEAELAARSAGLDEREWRVLREKFAEGRNQYEIGARLGVSQMQISRIQRRALRKLLTAVRGGEDAAAAPSTEGRNVTASD